MYILDIRAPCTVYVQYRHTYTCTHVHTLCTTNNTVYCHNFQLFCTFFFCQPRTGRLRANIFGTGVLPHQTATQNLSSNLVIDA
jgi:hypothetical protein